MQEVQREEGNVQEEGQKVLPEDLLRRHWAQAVTLAVIAQPSCAINPAALPKLFLASAFELAVANSTISLHVSPPLPLLNSCRTTSLFLRMVAKAWQLWSNRTLIAPGTLLTPQFLIVSAKAALSLTSSVSDPPWQR